MRPLADPLPAPVAFVVVVEAVPGLAGLPLPADVVLVAVALALVLELVLELAGAVEVVLELALAVALLVFELLPQPATSSMLTATINTEHPRSRRATRSRLFETHPTRRERSRANRGSRCHASARAGCFVHIGQVQASGFIASATAPAPP